MHHCRTIQEILSPDLDKDKKQITQKFHKRFSYYEVPFKGMEITGSQHPDGTTIVRVTTQYEDSSIQCELKPIICKTTDEFQKTCARFSTWKTM